MASSSSVVGGKVFGSLLGLAVGDAVGTAVEFMPPGSFEPVETMRGGGKFTLLPGQWTDDTSMALCIAESLVECQGFNPTDQMRRYWRWYQEGHLSSTGECFDIGMTTRQSLNKFQRSHGITTRNSPQRSRDPSPFCGSTAKGAAGNGSLMRLCPVPLVFHKHPLVAMEIAKESSRTTHGAKAALDACRYFSGLLLGCIQGVDKETLLSSHFCPIKSDYWKGNPMVLEVDVIAAGSYKKLEPPDIKASGYVVRSLEAVLWAFYHTENFKDGCLKVVNLGDDADTVGAIYGQLAGAFYGVDAIPEEWKKKCALYPLIEVFAGELSSLADSISIPDADIESVDWDALYPPVETSNFSDVYRNLKLQGYDFLEEKNKNIVRKLNPCPKSYKSLDDFDSDVSTLVKEYEELPLQNQAPAILADFQKRWTDSRKLLELKLNRKRI